ncbi:unnamed protein product [Effrenium voratum]|nr:unnamed protein product [Effrenium voratum]
MLLQDTDSATYNLANRTEYYDVFLSHDWGTSRWLKLISMMIIFNSQAAAITGLVVSISVGILRVGHLMPDEMWTVLIGYGAYLIILCFWQRLRSLFFRPLVVFVDKLCIAQHDEELKEKGILGLAGFIDHAKKLTILWSPRYFQRLWCAYEIAAFMRAEEKPLQVMPVKMSVLVCLMAACWHVLTAGFYAVAWADIGTTIGRRLFASLFMSVFLLIVTPLLCYIGMELMDDISQLPQQLRTFRIQESRCFCCSANHVHPITGRQMICDRSLVFHTLQKWFGTHSSDEESELDESHLELFNEMIQRELSQTILRTVGTDTLPLSYCIYMVSAGNFPFLAQYIPQLVAGLREDVSALNACVYVARQFMAWAILSLLSLCAVRISMSFWKVGVYLSSEGSRFGLRSRPVLSVILTPLIILTISLIWLPFQFAYALTSEYSTIPAIPFGVVIILTFYLFLPPRESIHDATFRSQLSNRYHSHSQRETLESPRATIQSQTTSMRSIRASIQSHGASMQSREAITSRAGIWREVIEQERGSSEAPQPPGKVSPTHPRVSFESFCSLHSVNS